MEFNNHDLNNLFVKCIFAHNRFAEPNWRISICEIKYYNLVLVYDGTGTFIRNGEKKNVKRGDLVFFNYGESQYMYNNTGEPLKFYTFNFQYVLPTECNGNWTLSTLQLPFPFVTHIQDELLFSKMLHLYDRLCRAHISESKTRTAEERALIGEILNLSLYATKNKALHCNFRVKNKIDDAVRYMAKEYNKKITVEDLAKRFDISPSHFALMFKRITGSSVIDYLIRLRITKAKLLLQDDRKVSEVSEEVGFSDVYYFSKMFKKLVGSTPSKYRHDAKMKLLSNSFEK